MKNDSLDRAERVRIRERLRVSISRTVTGLRGTQALVRTRRASVTDLMALMTRSVCPRVVTLSDHEKGVPRRSDDDQFVRFPCRFDKSTVTSRAGGKCPEVSLFLQHICRLKNNLPWLIGIKRQSCCAVAFYEL